MYNMIDPIYRKPMPKKFIVFRIVVLVVILAIGYGFITTRGQQRNSVDVSQAQPFVIQSGESIDSIANHLLKQGYIESVFLFKSYVWMKGLHTKILAGEYNLGIDWTMGMVVNTLSTGPLSNERIITIIEGWSIKDIDSYLRRQGVVTDDSFLRATGVVSGEVPPSLRDEYDFIRDLPKNATLEGYLFPETYRIFKSASAEQIVRIMLNEFAKKVSPQLREDIKKQKKGLRDTIILASIVEKEVSDEKDRKIAADLFIRRLRNGMPLQSDASVNYVTGKNLSSPTQDDVAVDSPYNTYKYQGLPPGPISNPGLVAILAAVYPAPNEYWYFLSAKSDGHTVWSKTFEEHISNKAKYLR